MSCMKLAISNVTKVYCRLNANPLLEFRFEDKFAIKKRSVPINQNSFENK